MDKEKTIEELGFFEQSYAVRVKPVTTAPKTPNEPQGRDTFQTPNYATDLLIPFIPKYVTNIWEPAAGDGMIVKRLKNAGYDTWATDIRNNPEYIDEIANFLVNLPSVEPQCIITNPPFSIKELFIEKAFEYGTPFAMLINADYSGQTIDWVKRGCEKIIPTSRIAFITPNIINRINTGEGTEFTKLDDIPQKLLYKYSSAQFHSMWLTYRFNLGRTETFVDLTVEQRKTNIY